MIKTDIPAVILLVALMTTTACASSSKCREQCGKLDGLISWWRADGNAEDSQRLNPGKLQNGATFSRNDLGQGELGQAFSFNGNGAYVSADAKSIGDLQKLTLDAWVKMNQLPADKVSRILTLGPNDKAFLRYDGRNGFQRLEFSLTIDGTVRSLQVDRVLRAGQFQHFAGTYSGDEMRLYVDGQLLASLPVHGSLASAQYVYISSPTEPFAGLIDEVDVFDRALSEGQIEALSAYGTGHEAQLGCAPAPADMLSWWPGEDSSEDIRGLNDAGLEGVDYAPGKVGNAFRFDSNTDRALATTLGFPIGNNDRTLELWVRNDNPAAQDTFFAGYGIVGAAQNQGYGLFTTGARVGFGWHASQLGPPLQPKTWYHLAVINNDNMINLYVNGANAGTYNLPVNTASGTRFAIGRPPDPLGNISFMGLVDEVSIYNRALHPDEILAIYLAGSAGKCRS